MMRHTCETIQEVGIQWNKHDGISKDSEPPKNLRENLNHKFKWDSHQKNLEASFITIIGPTLNNQLDTNLLMVSLGNVLTYCKLNVYFQPFIYFYYSVVFQCIYVIIVL